MKPLKILIACERFGAVRDAFIKRGHNAVSCDIEDTETPGPHIKGYLEDAIGSGEEWDFIVGFPPCTYLCSSGLHWNGRVPGRAEKTEYALAFVAMMANKMKRAKYGGVFENPTGCISTRIYYLEGFYGVSERPGGGNFKPYQTIQPYMFGHDASKATNLWRVEGRVKWRNEGGVLYGIPMLLPINRLAGRMVFHDGKWRERFANQTDSGQNVLGPSEDRAAIRGKTYEGIADAMADQWLKFIEANQ